MILARVGVETRPVWDREVFRDTQGRQLDTTPFAESLRALRLARSLTRQQQQVAGLCGVCQATVWHPEQARKGPSWATLYRLAGGGPLHHRPPRGPLRGSLKKELAKVSKSSWIASAGHSRC